MESSPPLRDTNRSHPQPSANKVENKLKTIAALYFALAGISMLYLLFLPMHYQMMGMISSIDFPVPEGQPDPSQMFETMFASMKIMYVIMGIIGFLFAATALVTGLLIYRKKNRVLCIVGAAICCISIPLGTALGVWALLVLLDEKTKAEFGET